MLIGNKDPETLKVLVELANSARQEDAVRVDALDALAKLDPAAIPIEEILKLVALQQRFHCSRTRM